MNFKFTNHFLHKLEDIFAESDYTLRYEKGNFKAGYCLLNHQKVAVINKYFTTEGKINCILEILKSIELDVTNLNEKNKKLYLELSQTELKI